MCSHYQTLKDAELLLKKFGAPNKPAGGKYDMWPRYPGVFIRRPVEHDAGDEAVPEREAVMGRWGLISAMTNLNIHPGSILEIGFVALVLWTSRPRLNRGPMTRGALPVQDRKRHIGARKVVPAIADHLGHRRARLGQVGRQNWPGGRLR